MPLARKAAADSYVLHAVLRAIAGDTLGGGGGGGRARDSVHACGGNSLTAAVWTEVAIGSVG